MKTIADTLGVARSNLAEQARKHVIDSQATAMARTRPGDHEILPAIQRLVAERPSYGYRRITALLNRERRRQGMAPVNHKKELRIRRPNPWGRPRHTAYRPARTHEGVVIALRSNIRWCSDHLELTCRNGDVVRILFVIDACDREII